MDYLMVAILYGVTGFLAGWIISRWLVKRKYGIEYAKPLEIKRDCNCCPFNTYMGGTYECMMGASNTFWNDAEYPVRPDCPLDKNPIAVVFKHE